MARFKIGDKIEAKEKRKGFPWAVVTGIGDKYYWLKIHCGKATVLLDVVDRNYELVKD